TYSWDFGDGNPGTGVNPTHTYASAEEYTVTLTVSDGTDSDSAATAASITAPNTAPTADDKNATTEEDTAVTVTLTAEDPEECELTFSIVELPTNGTLSGFADQVCGAGSPNTDSGSVTYTPDPDFNGTDSFTYKANDGLADSNVATVTITVSAVNDPPVAMGDSASTSQDTPVTISVLANDSDVDGDPLTVTSATDPPKGSASVNGDYSITYAPDAGFFGTDSFDYSVSDGKGGTDTGTVSVTVTQAATMHVGDLDGWSAKLQKG
ncbi:MAG: tandem-95 repeat protein, partial [Gemmatimonadales bacterium]|nr:tandem-95 repeat protein [Gemmatimonadales bacterium]NIS67109.1 tandem-95 repeat protein [Gemmatimonadales bacterium]